MALAIVVGAFVLTPTAVQAAPFVLTPTSDSSPGIAIDPVTGTAHVAWGTRTGAAYPYNYQITYCQVPRGATACTNTKVLANPGNLDNFGTTQVLIKGAKVVILHSICCGVGTGTNMWQSTNGGLTFPSALHVMNEPSGFTLYRSAINPAGTGAMVNNSTGTRAGFVAFDGSSGLQTPPPQGGNEILGEGDVGWLNATTPFMTQMGYLTNNLYTRFFNSATTGYNTATNWLGATQIDTKLGESAIATGPAGQFVAATTTVGHTFDYHEIAVYRINDSGVAGAPAPIIQEADPAHAPTNLDLAEDDGGRLHAVWTDTGFDGKMYYEWSKDAVTWSPPTLIQLNPAAGGYDNRLAIAADGGGWVLTDSNGAGPISMAPIEPKGASSPPPRVKPTPTPTPTPTPIPPAPSCPATINVTTDAPAVVRSGGCFTGKSPVYTTTGAIRVGGIDLVPQGSSTLTVNTSAHTILSSGKAKYEVRAGSTVLARSTIDWNLKNPISISGIGAFGVKLFGLPVTGKADIWFTKGEGRIQINLDLPSPLDAVHANTVLRTTMNDGLVVDGFAVDAHDVPIGPVTVTKFNLTYSSGADTLEGSFSMKLPPGASDSVSGGLGLANGAFKHAELNIGPGTPPLPLPLWAAPPITLNRIGASASNDAKGFTMAGKVGIIAGEEIAGNALVGVDGSLELFVPSSRSYAQIRADGNVKIVGIPLGSGFVKVRSDGPLTFGGNMGIDFGVAAASFNTSGGVNLANGDFYAAGEAEVSVDLFVIAGKLKASSVVSTVGLAACGEVKGTIKKTGLSGSISLGYQKPWGKDSELGGCEIDKYIPASLKSRSVMVSAFGPSAFDPLAHAAQAGSGQKLTLKAGALAGVKVQGAGGRPGFTFAGPGGRTITVPANLTQPVIDASISAVPTGPDSVELQVKNPKGSWTVTADGGAPAIAQVYSAGALPVPKTTARLRRGKGAKRVLNVKTSNLGPQTLIVRELLPDGAAHQLGRITANGRKTLTFTPAQAAGGRRAIEAVIVNGAKVAGTKRLASYIAPKPGRLAAPKRVTVTRKHTGRTAVTVRWHSVTGAASYRILVSGSDGRKENFTTKRNVTKLAIPNVTYDDKLTIRVQAMPKFGAPGTARTASSKAIKLKKAKKKKR